MFTNHLRTALRSLFKDRLYTLINLLGLATGVACFVLVTAYVRHERSYDAFVPEADRVYRVVGSIEMEGQGEKSSSMVFGLGPTLMHDHPELVGSYCRWFDFQVPEHSLKYDDSTGTPKLFSEQWLYLVDSTVFDLHGYRLAQGDEATALARPGSIVLTQELARKYFGDADPMGRMMKWDGIMDVQVTGVLEEVPANSHIRFNGLVSIYTLLQAWRNIERQNWVWNPCWTYVRLADGATPGELERVFPDFIRKYYPDFLKEQVTHRLQPVRDIHLTSQLDYEMRRNGDRRSVDILALIGWAILVIAAVNFMNLATARSAYRAREVGVRKATGATRGQLIGRFLVESTLVGLLAGAGALLLILLAMPAFRGLAGQEVPLPEPLLPIVLGIGGLVGLLSGIYPAFFLSRFRPAVVLKANAPGSTRGQSLRKVLVVGQFAIALVLIVGTVFVQRQHEHLLRADLGFEQEQVVLIPVRAPMHQVYSALLPELKNWSGVRSASWANDVIGRKHNTHEYNWGDMQAGEWTYVPSLIVDEDFRSTVDLQMAHGRWFSREHPGDDSLSVVINETFAAQLHPEDPSRAIGERMTTPHGDERIVGIVKDFNFDPLTKPVTPFVFDMQDPTQWIRFLYLRLEPGNVDGTLSAIQARWEELTREFPFEHRFLDRQLQEQYEAQGTLAGLVGTFSGLAVFIACLGLFALASWTAEKRTREIGVRKVLGAGTGRIAMLVMRDLLVLVLVASVIAVPLAWTGVARWLQQFAFRTPLDPLVFAGALLLVFAVATITVGFRALQAARTDPVRALRHE